MQVNIVKLSKWRIPRSFVQSWLEDLSRKLAQKTSHKISKKQITLVFVDSQKMTQLNKDFRGKNKTTDILSFEGMESEELGELILCGDVIDSQAKDHKISKNQELGYLLIHGVLHLLGYEHECGGRKEKEMFALQDELFEILTRQYF